MRFGIIGTGRIARRFVPECHSVAGIDITAVYNPHEGSAARFTEEAWGGQTENKPCALEDISRLWDMTDAVYIASPHETHFKYIMTALGQGKHVLCEKPMVLSKAQAEEAGEYADGQGLILMEGLKTAYCPGYRKVLDLAHDGVVGEIRCIEACFTKLEDPESRELNDTAHGGSFTELGSYVMLPVIDLLGAEYGDISFDFITNEKRVDIFTKADIRYRDAMAMLICGLGVKSEGRLLISGTKGYIKADAPWWKTRHIEVHFEDESKVLSYDEPFEGDGLRYEISRFCELIKDYDKNKKTISISGIRSVAMADLMDRFLKQRAVQS